MIFGHFGDRLGRKGTLITTLDEVRLSYCLPPEDQLTKAGTILGELVTELVRAT